MEEDSLRHKDNINHYIPVKAIARNIRISPKKANLVAGLVRKKKAQEALDILKFTPKKAAKLLYKVLHSAVANAENNFKQKKDSLIIKEIVVTEGPTFKRSVPVSRGRVHPILKRNAHITVTLGLDEKAEEQAKQKKEKESKEKEKAKAKPKAKQSKKKTS
ncbi:50S ribosomal protein L22 [Candidatus Peregrinibacteria bacterium]|nr:50S ribosomal protein L22 [Candidatus Peregrinibacteria bacterium]